MAVADVRGSVVPTQDPVVRSLGIKGISGEVGELTFEGDVLFVNGVPIGDGASLRITADPGQVLYYNGTAPAGATGLYFSNSVVQPRTHIVPDISGERDLGSESNPFRDVHAGVSLRLGRLHLTASGDYVHVKGEKREYDIIPGVLARSRERTARSVTTRTAAAAAPRSVVAARNPLGTPTRKTVNIAMPGGKGSYIVIYHAQVKFTGIQPAPNLYFRITPDSDVAKQQQYSDVVEGHTHTYPVMFTVTNKSSTTITFEYPNGKMDVAGRFECLRV